MFLLLLSFLFCCLAKERGSLISILRDAEAEHNIPSIIPTLESTAEDGHSHTHGFGAPWQDQETGMWFCPPGSEKHLKEGKRHIKERAK